MDIKEIRSKTILSPSKVHDYVINPYVGCQHGCIYCYARFIKRFTGHHEPWGKFVDVKTNAADLLPAEVKRKRKGIVWVSGLCDPYQPLEAKYKLTRKCLAILAENNWPVAIQTRSPLVVRDIDIIKNALDFEAGLTITTADDGIRRLFEPFAPSAGDRIKALDELHRAGIRTYAMIAPILPGAEDLPHVLEGKVDSVILDRMNYHYADWVYRKYGLEVENSETYFITMGQNLASAFTKMGIGCNIVY